MTDEPQLQQPRFKPTVENMDTVRKKPVATLHMAFSVFFLLAVAGNIALWLTGQTITSYIIGMVLALFMVVGLIFSNWVAGGKFQKAVNLGMLLQAGAVVAGFLFLFGPEAGFLGFVAQSFFLSYAIFVAIISTAKIAFSAEAPPQLPEDETA